MRFALLFLSFCLLTLTAPLPLQAAQVGAPPGVTVVRPNDNGFPELLQAGDAALEDEATTRGKVLADADSGMATLTQRRAAVNEPAFRAAMAQMREALEDPIVAPSFAKSGDVMEFSGPVRRLARFLACEEYVLLSEGKTQAALDAFAEGLNLSARSKRWGMMGVLVGETAEVVTMRPIARHLDQFSARDCDKLYGLMKTELAAPDPAIEGIRAEKSLAHFAIDGAIAGMTAANDKILPDGTPADDDFQNLTTNERQEIMQMRTGDPQGIDALRKAALERLDTQYESAAAQLAVYPQAVQTPESLSLTTQFASNALVDRFVRAFSAVGNSYGYKSPVVVIQKAVLSRMRLQLLAVHAAILRWRWEHNVLPPDLSALKIGTLADDPFLRSGQPLVYTRLDNTHYTLASAGPPQRDDAGNVLPSSKRDAFTLDTPGP